MSILRETPVRKTIIRGNRPVNFDTFENVIVTDEYYKTNGESVIIVKETTLVSLSYNQLPLNHVEHLVKVMRNFA